jgi:hypothetical protein
VQGFSPLLPRACCHIQPQTVRRFLGTLEGGPPHWGGKRWNWIAYETAQGIFQGEDFRGGQKYPSVV